jgi:hypothetical protein
VGKEVFKIERVSVEGAKATLFTPEGGSVLQSIYLVKIKKTAF